ncbi:12717_t:CDS:2, partial [Acaulospora colombiana]
IILKRCFAFGELAVVAQAVTLLAVELWIITINKFVLMKNLHFRKHSPSEITTFQLALILGMLMIGIVLSPIFIRSRQLAQQPKWKNKRVHVRASNN